MELALIENLQREDLDIFEEAQAYLMMIEKYKFSHDEIGKIVGKSRTNISNTLRLLKLPKEIMESLRKKEISAGHARALLGIKNPKKIKEVWQRILMGLGWSEWDVAPDIAKEKAGKSKSSSKKNKKKNKKKTPAFGL